MTFGQYNDRAYLKHLAATKDLVTTVSAYRAGFVALALEKTRRASPFVDEARTLKILASRAETPTDLLAMRDIRQALLTASGVSDKALQYLSETDKQEAIAGLITKYLEPAGSNFVEELVYRFLLTRGDALGGAMRNVSGVIAQRRLTRSIISCLKLAGTNYWFIEKSPDKKIGPWSAARSTLDDADVELNVAGLSWQNDRNWRTLRYNLTVPVVGNNIDICLFKSSYTDFSTDMVKNAQSYIALGELKGGIDRAGADEHWKTARTALDRIQKSFIERKPATFFIGAAIEPTMAREIWALLDNGTLSNAANLTSEDQLSSIASWICQL